MLIAFLVGVLLGYVGSIPAAGPLAMLIAAAGLARDARRATLLAIGGATAESLYALGAFVGLGELLARYPLALPIARAMGAPLLIAFGVYLARTDAPSGTEAPSTSRGGALVGFALVALNPGFLLTWMALAAALSSARLAGTTPRAAAIATGAFVGIDAWFATLFVIARRQGGRLRPGTRVRVARAVGVVILGVGVWSAVDAARRVLALAAR